MTEARNCYCFSQTELLSGCPRLVSDSVSGRRVLKPRAGRPARCFPGSPGNGGWQQGGCGPVQRLVCPGRGCRGWRSKACNRLLCNDGSGALSRWLHSCPLCPVGEPRSAGDAGWSGPARLPRTATPRPASRVPPGRSPGQEGQAWRSAGKAHWHEGQRGPPVPNYASMLSVDESTFSTCSYSFQSRGDPASCVQSVG